MAKGWNESLTRQNTPAILELLVAFVNGRVFTTLFSGYSASDNRKSRENSYFSNSLKLSVGKRQWNCHEIY